MSEYKVVNIDLAVIGGNPASLNVGLEQDLAQYNAVEALLVLDSPQGSGTGPTLAVKLQGSMDNFKTAGGVHDVIGFAPATGAMSEAKTARKTYGAAPVMFGRFLRVNLAAGTTAGDIRFTGKLYLYFFQD